MAALVLGHVKVQQQLQACQLPLCSAVQLLKQSIHAHAATAPADAPYRVSGSQTSLRDLHMFCSVSMLAQQQCGAPAEQWALHLAMQVHPDLGDAPIQGPNQPLDSIYKLPDGMLCMTALSM